MGIVNIHVMGILNTHELPSWEYSKLTPWVFWIFIVTLVFWIFLKWRHYYEYSKKDVIEWILKIPMSLWIFKIPMASAFEYSKYPWGHFMNIYTDVSFWTFKMPMTSLHEYSKYPWLSFMDIQNNPWRHLLNIQNTHRVTSWIFKYAWSIFKPSCHLMNILNLKKTVVMGILNILNLKLACFCVLSQNHQHFFEI